MEVVPIAQRSSTAGITITLKCLEIYEGGLAREAGTQGREPGWSWSTKARRPTIR